MSYQAAQSLLNTVLVVIFLQACTCLAVCQLAFLIKEMRDELKASKSRGAEAAKQ